MREKEWSPPNWFYTDKRPSSDHAFFENMCRIIFQAGLNWRVVDKKWPTTQKAFDKFSTEKVSYFTDSDIARLMKDEGIVRNKGKNFGNHPERQRVRKNQEGTWLIPNIPRQPRQIAQLLVSHQRA